MEKKWELSKSKGSRTSAKKKPKTHSPEFGTTDTRAASTWQESSIFTPLKHKVNPRDNFSSLKKFESPPKVSPQKNVTFGPSNLSHEYQRRVQVRHRDLEWPSQPPKRMEWFEDDELANAFKEQISIDKDLESVKQMLALKSDFNLEDAFQLFDVDNRGSVSLREMEDGFNICKLYPAVD